MVAQLPVRFPVGESGVAGDGVEGVGGVQRGLAAQLIVKLGKAVMLFPEDSSWDVFMNGISSFTEDFMEGVRNQGKHDKRDPL